MPTFGLVVEGIYDEAALKEIIQKCSISEIEIISRRCGDKVQLIRKFPGFLEDFQHIIQGANVDKVLVIRDADNKPPAELINRMQSRISNRTYRFPVKPLVIVQELEAWLLADESAIAAVTQRQTRRVGYPERLTDPKEKLRRVLSDANIAYTAEIARQIAESAQVDTIAARCPSFRQFRQAVIDC